MLAAMVHTMVHACPSTTFVQAGLISTAGAARQLVVRKGGRRPPRVAPLAAAAVGGSRQAATTVPPAAAVSTANDELPFREYIPDINAQYWSSRPGAVASRTIQISAALGDWLLHGWLGARRGASPQQITEQRADKLRRLLTDLGPAFVKIGQAVSSRPDVAPPEFLRELEKLQVSAASTHHGLAPTVWHQQDGWQQWHHLCRAPIACPPSLCPARRTRSPHLTARQPLR